MITVITRKPSRSLSDCELTFLERTPIDYETALSQHDEYERFFRENGCNVVSLPPEEKFPDSVFVEDAAVVFDEVAVLMSPGVASRRGEVDLISPVLEQYRELVRIEPPALIDGGDVLTIGKTVLVGHSTRTNRAGSDALAEVLEPHGYSVIRLAVDGALHLKTGCTALDDNTLLINPDFVDARDLTNFRIINIDSREPFAANTIRFKNKIIMNFEREMYTPALVRRGGYQIRGLDISEFRKAEGLLTCLSLIFED